MSGHSKWSNIKHKKAANDQKRAATFNKIAKAIQVEAERKGGDPETNYTLRSLIEKAKQLNIPKDKIETAIKKGTGELKGAAKLEELLLEGFGPGGVAIMVKAITDNRNRTISEVKNIFKEAGAKFTGENSVRFMFKQNEEMEWVATNTITPTEEDKQQLEKLYEALDDHDDVQEIYSNELE